MLKASGFAIVAVLCIASVSRAGVYYVRPDGDNTHTGTGPDAANAWATVVYAADTVVAGDTVIIAPGTYTGQVTPDNVGTTGNVITYEGDLDGSEFADIGAGEVRVEHGAQVLVKQDAHYMTFRDMTLSGRYQGTLISGESLTFDNVTFIPQAWNAYDGHSGTSQEDDLLFTNCTLTDGSQDTLLLYRLDDAADGGTTLVTIEDCLLSRSASNTSYALINVDASQQTASLTLNITGSTITAFADDEMAIEVDSSVCTIALDGNTITGLIDFAAASAASGDNNTFLSITRAEAIAAGYTPGPNDRFTDTPAVPEPATMTLMALGALGLLIRRCRRR